MVATIKYIEYFLPEEILTNDDLEKIFPDLSSEKIRKKTGIVTRHIAKKDECSSDLAFQAVNKMFENRLCKPEEIDYIIFCTQSPDYFLPTTACLLQERLNIPTSSGAIDLNLGCSGYIYALGLAKGLIETYQVKTALLIMAETYSKYIKSDDRSVRTIFGDAASATLLINIDSEHACLGPFLYGTDGRGKDNLIVRNGGMRYLNNSQGDNKPILYMNGPEIFNFTLETIPSLMIQLLNVSGLSYKEITWFVFHQANSFILEHLRSKLSIPKEKFYINITDCGNTVSSSIPIALKNMDNESKLKSGDIIMLIGFGVGYSWGGTIVRWM